jgi:hypothetical protein
MATNELIEQKYKIDPFDLYIGQSFKSYKEMCKFFNQPYISKSPHSKESQLKEWKRYIDWEKDGQQIVVTDIYPTPLDKNDGRVTNGTQKYQQYIEDILLAYMDSKISKGDASVSIEGCSDYQFLFTLNGIALLCKMVNKKYLDKNIDKILMSAGYTKFNIKDFFSRTELKFSLIINNALRNMEKRKIINYNKILIIEENSQQRVATLADEDKFLNVEKIALNTMGFGSITEVFACNKAKEYYSLIDKNVKEKFGWDKCYKAYVLSLNNYSINLEKEYLEKTNQTNKLELNQRLVTFFNNQANNKFIKSCKNELNGFRLPPDYRKQQLGLSDYLLKIDNE